MPSPTRYENVGIIGRRYSEARQFRHTVPGLPAAKIAGAFWRNAI
jgi:hypothetical protein